MTVMMMSKSVTPAAIATTMTQKFDCG